MSHYHQYNNGGDKKDQLLHMHLMERKIMNMLHMKLFIMSCNDTSNFPDHI
jgi:hypothetical protein